MQNTWPDSATLRVKCRTDLQFLRRVEDGLDEDDVAGLGEVEPVGARRDRQQQHLHVGTVLQIDLESFKSCCVRMLWYGWIDQRDHLKFNECQMKCRQISHPIETAECVAGCGHSI